MFNGKVRNTLLRNKLACFRQRNPDHLVSPLYLGQPLQQHELPNRGLAPVAILLEKGPLRHTLWFIPSTPLRLKARLCVKTGFPGTAELSLSSTWGTANQ